MSFNEQVRWSFYSGFTKNCLHLKFQTTIIQVHQDQKEVRVVFDFEMFQRKECFADLGKMPANVK